MSLQNAAGKNELLPILHFTVYLSCEGLGGAMERTD